MAGLDLSRPPDLAHFSPGVEAHFGAFHEPAKAALPERLQSDPAFFYLPLRPYIASAALTDTIMGAVKHMGGKTFDVYSPGDFAEAIRDVSKALEARKAPNT